LTVLVNNGGGVDAALTDRRRLTTEAWDAILPST